MPEQLLYHAFRGTLFADHLVPLEYMRFPHVYRDIYKARLARYHGRMNLLETRIPPLGCRWRDVVFLSAIPSHVVFNEVRAAIDEVNPFDVSLFDTFRSEWSMISFGLCDLDPSRLAVYFPQPGMPQEGDFLPFSEDLWSRLMEFNPWTRTYYRETLRAGERPLYWNGLPHILCSEPISIIGREIVRI